MKRKLEKIITNLYFGAIPHMTILWYGIGNNNSLKAGIVDARNRRTRENAVRQYGIDLEKIEMQNY